MATPSINNVIKYVNTKLTGQNWNSNLQTFINFLTSGLYDFILASLTIKKGAIFNDEAGDNDFIIKKATSGIAYQYDAGNDKHIFGSNLEANIIGNVTGNVTGDLTGDVTGDVTGNVTGDVTGNITGDVTGDVTGNITGNLTGTAYGTMKRIYSNTLTSATTSINITGLDGVTDIDYILKVYLSTTKSGTLELILNNDTGNNYYYENILFVGSNLSNSEVVANNYFLLGSFNNGTLFSEINISGKKYKKGSYLFNKWNNEQGGSSDRLGFNAGYWDNLANNLTSIQIVSSIADGIETGSLIELYARR